jgi:DUF4097 and DUF4098 domain-containing protein YvlB
MKVALASALLAGAFAVPAHAEDCKHTAHRTANSAGPDIERVVVEASAGDLVVRGGQGRDVTVDGKACASSSKLLDESKLEIRRDGNTVYVRTVLPDMNGNLFGFSHYAHMDVTVAVPKTATLKIEDSSGDMQVTDVQAANIADSSGDQTLERIAGDLEVADSSGEIKIVGVGGGLRLKDSSGDVDVNDVRGDVVVEVDSSGDLDIRRVTGGVHIREDSSGDIEIHDVKRDVTIDDDSSGGILVQDVGGNFTVGSDGSGGIRYERVTGSVRVPD